VLALGEVPSLAPLDNRTLLEIAGDSANLVWRAGSTVFEAGTPSDALYIVVSGCVRVVAATGKEIATLGPGSFFGEHSLLLGTAHGQTVEAVEDTELMVVPRERFDAVMAAHGDVAAAIRARAEERQAENIRAGLV
jgi:CRP-like cAMP-binding protein